MIRQPLALFTGGATGSGKSELAEMVAARHALVSLDPDHIMAALVDRRPSLPSDRLRTLALRLLDRWQARAIVRRWPLLINTTAADLAFVTDLRCRLERAGYRTAMVFVAADEAECRRRNRARRRPRPPSTEQRFQQITSNLPSLERQFGHFLCVENYGDLAGWRSTVEQDVLPWVSSLA